MGRATDALLIYGYDLGSDDAEGGWKVQQVNEYGYLLPTSWYDPDDEGDEDDEDGNDFATAADAHLVKIAGGFTETFTAGADEGGFWDRRKQAQDRVGVSVATYCSDGAPMYALAAHVTRVARGEVELIDPLDLAARPAAEDWDSRLVVALDALELVPVQKTPRWFLVSFGDGFGY
jgi:hypothetical protein